MEMRYSPQPPALSAGSSSAGWNARSRPASFHMRSSRHVTALGLAATLLLLASIGLRWEFAQYHHVQSKAQQQLRFLPTGASGK
ncbi:MAG: hypothetical protein ACREJN_08255 [Nitrospiraceae bacterium]